MVAFLDDLFGAAGYVRDEAVDVWVAPDRDYDGPGRGFLVIRRGGNWTAVVIPPEALS